MPDTLASVSLLMRLPTIYPATLAILVFLLASCAHAPVATTTPIPMEEQVVTGASPVDGPSLAQTPIRWAYYVPEESSLASLRQRNGQLDYVALHWASFKEDGSLEIKANPDLLPMVRGLGARPILSVTAGTGPDIAHALLSTEASRAAAVEALFQRLAEYDGVSIDFEGLKPEDRDPLTQFMAQLAGRLRPAGKLVTIALSAKTTDTRTGWAGAHDYAGLAPNADLFVLMSYGYRTAQSSLAGSSAPTSWVESTLSFAMSQLPAQKILLGVPGYGYDWDTTSGPPARAMRYSDAMAIANQQGIPVQYDAAQNSARFGYTKDGHAHDVWFEDRSTFTTRVALVSQRGLAGFALWRLGHEDPQVWQTAIVQSPAPTTAPTPGPQTPATTQPPAPTQPPASGQKSGTNLYFAEGSTTPPFDSWFLLQNPGQSPASANVTFMRDDGSTASQRYDLPPTSRLSIFANQIVPNSAFSTMVESDQTILAERAMYAGFDGHDVTAATSPSRLWYFAEGATTQPFHSWLLLQNPAQAATTAKVSFLLENGTTVERGQFLPPRSRVSLFVNQILPDAAFSTKVESERPIIVERAMYRFPGNAATAVTGVSAPSKSWFFAGGMPSGRNQPFDSWLLLQNPGSAPVTASITLFASDGQQTAFQQFLPPTSRQSLFLNQLTSAPSYGIRIEATGEIVAERSVYLGATSASGNQPQGAHATQGAPEMGKVWALPEGSTASPFTERISVLNPHAAPMSVRFEFMLENGQTQIQNATIQPGRNYDLDVETVVRSAGISTKVITSLPSVVERTMFWTKEGKVGTHNTIGIRLE
jgi:spore germination protein